MSDLATIEDRLRRTYQAVADTTVLTGDDELPDPPTFHVIDRPDHDADHGFDLVELDANRGPGRRRLLLTAAAAAVVTLGAAAIVVVGGGTDEPTAQTGSTFGPGWTRIADAPIEPRDFHNVVWTGDEMVVFGGYSDSSGAGTIAEGAAAYDPDTDTWREIAEPPESVRGYSISVWTGDEVVALPMPWVGSDGGEGSYEQDERPGAAYDPESDTWRTLPTSGIGALNDGSQLFWTGDRVIVLGMENPDGEFPSLTRVGLYDPVADSWRQLDDAPVEIVTDAAWTGDELVYVGPSDEIPARMVAVALDVIAGTWRELPAPPLSSRYAPVVEWTGSELLVAGGTSDELLVDGATFDPTTQTWEQLPDAPTSFLVSGDVLTGGGAGTGQLVITGPDDVENGPLVLDLEANTWSRGQPFPGRAMGPFASTGSMLLAWSGSNLTGQPRTAGYAYVP